MKITDKLGRRIATDTGTGNDVPHGDPLARLRERLQAALERRYPYLRFRVWHTPWDTADHDQHPLTPHTRIQVFAGEVSAGFACHWPLTKATKHELERINRAAATAEQAGYFYCSRCRQAKHDVELGKADPGYALCVDCYFLELGDRMPAGSW